MKCRQFLWRTIMPTGEISQRWLWIIITKSNSLWRNFYKFTDTNHNQRNVRMNPIVGTKLKAQQFNFINIEQTKSSSSEYLQKEERKALIQSYRRKWALRIFCKRNSSVSVFFTNFIVVNPKSNTYSLVWMKSDFYSSFFTFFCEYELQDITETFAHYFSLRYKQSKSLLRTMRRTIECLRAATHNPKENVPDLAFDCVKPLLQGLGDLCQLLCSLPQPFLILLWNLEPSLIYHFCQMIRAPLDLLDFLQKPCWVTPILPFRFFHDPLVKRHDGCCPWEAPWYWKLGLEAAVLAGDRSYKRAHRE